MQLSVILLSLVGLVVSTPVDIAKFKINEVLLTQDAVTRNSALENLILDLLEDLREIMLHGSDDVPVLDPFEMEHLHLDEEILTLPDSHLTIKDLKVSKLSTFVTDRLDVSIASIIPLIRYRVEFDFHVPVLEIEAANYDLFVTESGINIFGNGDAKINLIEPRVKGFIVVGPRINIGTGLYLRITNTNISVSLKAFDSQINGLMNDPEMSEFINTFLKYFVPELLELYEDEISTFLSNTVQEVANEILADLDLSGILG